MSVFCLACSHEQQGCTEVLDYYICERCGAKILGDGGVEYDGSREGIQDAQDNIDFFDSDYRDREDWERNRGRR